ncbi:MHYT domain-containing protein [Microbulbifer bruguierae]|uniref:MHYT domain-containing protein n=1 Tax=Microbulbifer bruguierae TaxID=3029061 RepID=A0ABY8ND84_9GAMM|nr:MHYT domain-containing protein [Microbulbifer bruguierae]WGL16415.1 MHYT domain-containing protein [Microbulbifer bruguierae]
MLSQYNLSIVFVSYVISVLGSFAALQLVTAIPAAATRAQRRTAILCAGLALGGGAIWSMHFVGMLALQTEMRMAYDVWGTAVSLVIAIAACTFGMWVCGSGRFSIDRLLPAAVFMGAGVAGMHYYGMAAMLMPAEVSYNLNIILISVIIAVVASFAALWMAFNMQGGLQKFASALVMGVAVCGMHYTGMAAISYRMTGVMPEAGWAGSVSETSVEIFAGVVVLSVLVLAIGVARWYRKRPVFAS